MSCIVGIKHEGKVYMGADGFATTDEGQRRPVDVNKIISNKNYLIGFTGSVRSGQILDSHNFEPPEKIEDFAEALRDHLFSKGCVAVAEGGIHMHTCNLLIAHGIDLWEVHMDFQFNKILGNYSAIGAGAFTAFGALYVLDKFPDINPVDKLEMALEAASEFNTNCGPPFTFEVI